LRYSLSNSSRGRGTRWRWCVLKNDIGPSLEDLIGNMHLPVDSKQESNFVLVNLFSSESRDLAPGARRIISVLKILGGKDQSSKKHATAALECAVSMSVHRLFHCEIMFRHMRLDENQVIQSNLES
jgi:hypothetical protein